MTPASRHADAVAPALGRVVCGELHRAKDPNASPDVVHTIQVGQRGKRRLQLPLQFPGALEDTLPLDDVENGECGHAGAGMARVGVAVTPDHPGTLEERLGDSRSGDDPSERQVTGGDSLGKGDDVRLEIETRRGEPVTTPSEPGDHLVGDKESTGSPHRLAHRWEIALRRWSHPAGADDRLADHRRHPLRPDVVDRLLHRLGVVVGYQDHILDERPVPDAVWLHPPQRGAETVHPVVCPLPGDEHGPFGLTDLVEIPPGQLGGGVHRVGPTTGEEHLASFDGSERGDPVGQLERRWRAEVDEDVIGV